MQLRHVPPLDQRGVHVGPVDQDSITIDGPARRFQSSDWAERGFCDTCGSNLWYRITAEGPGHGQYNFAAGLFDTGDMKIGREFSWTPSRRATALPATTAA